MSTHAGGAPGTSATTGAPGTSPRPLVRVRNVRRAVRDLAYRRPEWAVLGAAVVGWVALAALLWLPVPDGAHGPGARPAIGGAHHGLNGADPSTVGGPGVGGNGPGTAAIEVGTGGGAGLGETLVSVGAGVGLWLVMLVAMMLPALVPAVRYVAFAGARPRRQRTVAWFVAGYLAVWVPLGLVVALVHALVPAPGPIGIAALLVGVALWEVGPVKRRALRACHRTAPIRYTGRAADRSAARFGWRHGAVCLRLCGPLMVVVALAGHPLWLTVGASLVVWAQKLVRGAESATPAVAAAAVLAAVTVGAVGATG